MTPGEYEGMLFRLRQLGESSAADLIISLREALEKIWPYEHSDDPDLACCAKIARAALSQSEGDDK